MRDRRVLWAVLLGNTGLIWMIGYGTFVTYSWDVMEPIAYFICAAVGLFCSARFLAMHRRFSLTGWLKWRKPAASEEKLARRDIAKMLQQLDQRSFMKLL